MGSGKGSPDHWVAVAKAGRIIFVMSGVNEEIAKEAMHLASQKLPVKTKFVTRETGIKPSRTKTDKELAQIEK